MPLWWWKPFHSPIIILFVASLYRRLEPFFDPQRHNKTSFWKSQSPNRFLLESLNAQRRTTTTFTCCLIEFRRQPFSFVLTLCRSGSVHNTVANNSIKLDHSLPYILICSNIIAFYFAISCSSSDACRLSVNWHECRMSDPSSEVAVGRHHRRLRGVPELLIELTPK